MTTQVFEGSIHPPTPYTCIQMYIYVCRCKWAWIYIRIYVYECVCSNILPAVRVSYLLCRWRRSRSRSRALIGQRSGTTAMTSLRAVRGQRQRRKGMSLDIEKPSPLVGKAQDVTAVARRRRCNCTNAKQTLSEMHVWQSLAEIGQVTAHAS